MQTTWRERLAQLMLCDHDDPRHEEAWDLVMDWKACAVGEHIQRLREEGHPLSPLEEEDYGLWLLGYKFTAYVHTRMYAEALAVLAEIERFTAED